MAYSYKFIFCYCVLYTMLLYYIVDYTLSHEKINQSSQATVYLTNPKEVTCIKMC